MIRFDSARRSVSTHHFQPIAPFRGRQQSIFLISPSFQIVLSAGATGELIWFFATESASKFCITGIVDNVFLVAFDHFCAWQGTQDSLYSLINRDEVADRVIKIVEPLVLNKAVIGPARLALDSNRRRSQAALLIAPWISGLAPFYWCWSAIFRRLIGILFLDVIVASMVGWRQRLKW